jgi:hypothetical protein
MGAELKAEAAQTTAAFTDRSDFEELRRAFGGEVLDVGTPLGSGFKANLETMLGDLNLELDKDTKDTDFPRRAARKVRRFSQWWTFVRIHLETRRDQLAKDAANHDAQHLLGYRLRRPDVLAVLSEIIKVVATFERISMRCVRGVEDILTSP